MASYQRRSRSEWQSLMSTFESSGLSVKGFCTTNALSQASFYQWRQRLAEPSSAPANPLSSLPFIDVSALSSELSMVGTPWRIELDLGDGLTLRLNRG